MLFAAAAQVHVLSCQFCTVPFRTECPPPAYSLCGFCKAVSYFLCNFRITSSKNRFDASVKLLLLDFSLEPPLFYDIGGLLFGERKRVLWIYACLNTNIWLAKAPILFAMRLYESYSFFCSNSWVNFLSWCPLSTVQYMFKNYSARFQILTHF
jgi:hypothetical protein